MPDSISNSLNQNDVIVARATPPGQSAIAIVRIDGKGAGDLIRKLFQPVGKKTPVESPREAILGQWVESPADGKESNSSPAVIDEGLTIYFPAPHSYTGNDLGEMYCHGSPAVVRNLIAATMRLGARLAEPGEFTRRAFLNGRLDLAQAEAVADLICAETDAAARSARTQLAGGLSSKIAAIRDTLVTLAAEIEARIDFPDEGIDEADLDRLTSYFRSIKDDIGALMMSRRRGKLLREGARVALIGAPNVGKSSLLNALARADRAIVTPHPGTTRDTIECTIDLEGIAVTLIDTAGLRDSEEPIERLGIERSRRAIDEADCVIEIRDTTRQIEPTASANLHRPPDLIVENKIDLVPSPPLAPPNLSNRLANQPVVHVSALTGIGMDLLENALLQLLCGESGCGHVRVGQSISINERHAVLLERTVACLAQARQTWNDGANGELAMIDLRDALAALDEILGITSQEAILDRVFERFCIGK